MVYPLILLLLMIGQQNDDPLQKYRWENRILLIYANNMGVQQAAEQISLFEKEKEGFAERDLLFFFLPENGKADHPFTPEEEERIRSRFVLEDQAFLVILIGKDGGEKLRKEEILTNEALFATIDAMPMRRSEMRRKQ